MYTSYRARDLRFTTNIAKVVRTMLRDPTAEYYGYDLMRKTGMPSGRLYPILAQLEAAEWIEGRREDIDAATAGRPPRRFYRLTPDGTVLARQGLAELLAQLGVPPLRGLGRPEGSPA